jgi:4,5-DOPA dioxygenase extradiol
MKRRDALKTLAMGVAVGVLPACRGGETEPRISPANRATQSQPLVAQLPSLFLAHGSPMLMDDAPWVAELRAWAHALPKPQAILMLSAHWVGPPVRVGATRTVPLVYDFYGFPDQYYAVKYPAPGAPGVAKRVRQLLAPLAPVQDDPNRGLDHGAYVPLLCMYPQADVPVLQVSLPSLDASTVFAMGKALAPLRDESVLIVGSGFITHNMRTIDTRPNAAIPSWASEFDAFVADALQRHDTDALLDYQHKGPGARESLPTVEHFVPLLAAWGATLGTPRGVTFPIAGFSYGSFTKRSVQFS